MQDEENQEFVPRDLMGSKTNQLPTIRATSTESVESEGGVHCLRMRIKGCPGQLELTHHF